MPRRTSLDFEDRQDFPKSLGNFDFRIASVSAAQQQISTLHYFSKGCVTYRKKRLKFYILPVSDHLRLHIEAVKFC